MIVIKRRYEFSNEDITEEIRENSCMQYFSGFAEYSREPPFDPSMMTRFREWVTPEMMVRVNNYVTKKPHVFIRVLLEKL